MVIDFKINILLENKRKSITYPLSKTESQELVETFGIDFLNIPARTPVATLSIDVFLEDIEMVKSILQIISDVFPSHLNNFKKSISKRKNIIDEYLLQNTKSYMLQDTDIIFEFDKVFMVYYVLKYTRDNKNINRNISRKMEKLGIVAIDFVPFVSKITFTDNQLLSIASQSIYRSIFENNFYIINLQNIIVGKMEER